MVVRHESQGSVMREHVVPAAFLALVVAMVVWWLHGPAVSLVLTGDTYQWVQHAHAAAHEPLLLLSKLDNFYRPSATWLLVVDRIVWGGFNAAGYRTTSLIVHAMIAFLLGIAGRRLGLGWTAAAAVALIWATSPFTHETVFVVAARHDLLLLAPWLLMIIIWPRSGESWSRCRIAGVGLMVVLAAAAKETWVVTPGLVAALEYERTRSWRASVIPTVVAGLSVAVYLIAYVAVITSSKEYMEFGLHVAAKIPNQVAAFLYLAEPMVDRFSLHWKGIIGLAAIAALVAVCIQRRVSGTWVALFLLLAPTLPTLAVPYMPQRYLTVPYAGFVLLLALWFGWWRDRLTRWRWTFAAGAAAVVVVVTVVGSVITRADLEDYRRIAAAHHRLLDEAKEVVSAVRGGALIAVVRDERSLPTREVLAELAGLPKIAFVRNFDPYGLVDSAALFEWVLADENIAVENVSDRLADGGGLEGVVIVHQDGVFVVSGRSHNFDLEVDRWMQLGRAVQLLQARELDR